MSNTYISALTAAYLSKYAYDQNPSILLEGWESAGQGWDDGDNRYDVLIDDSTKQIVIAFKGTNTFAQFKSDITDSGGSAWESIKAGVATTVYHLRIDYQGYSIMTDGHSLGGGLAQTAALEFDLSGYSQNALPISEIAIDTDLGGQGNLGSALQKWVNSGATFNATTIQNDVTVVTYGRQEFLYTDPRSDYRTTNTILPNNYLLATKAGVDLGALGAFFQYITPIGALTAWKAHGLSNVIDELKDYGATRFVGTTGADESVSYSVLSVSNTAFALGIYDNGQLSETLTGTEIANDQFDLTALIEPGATIVTPDLGASGVSLSYAVDGDSSIDITGADTVSAGSDSVTVMGGAGDTTVSGADVAFTFIGGTGAVSVVGGAGDATMVGGTGSADTVFVAGTGNDTLVGGSGSGPTTLVGGSHTVEIAAGTGATTLYAGDGLSLINGTTGSGQELVFGAQGGVSSIALNAAQDTVVAGGYSTVVGGAGPDLYAFLGTAATSEAIEGFKAGDQIAFAQPTTVQEAVIGGSDLIQTDSGTLIELVGYDHKLFG